MSSARREMSKTAADPTGAFSMRRTALASLAGATLEWYDFQLYGWLSALAFNKLFFPAGDPAVGTLVAFMTFGIGFIMRPVGAIVFGHLGDRIGRKSTLLITLLLTGIPTVVMGLLPTYQTIGVWAPLLLVALRLLQGFGLGGEFGGAALMVVEHAPAGKRGFWGMFAGLGNPVGQLLSIIVVYACLASMPDETFLAWGWRVPYLLGIVILAAGLYVRFRVIETPAFHAMRESGGRHRVPAKNLFAKDTLTILKGWGARVADAGTWAVFLVFGISYATTELGISKTQTTLGVAIALVMQILVIIWAGRLSDRIGRRPVIMIGAVVVAVGIFPSFLLINTADPLWLWVAFALGFPIGTGMIFAPVGAFLPELFDSRVRYTGTSIVFQLSSLAAGLVPTIATTLMLLNGHRPWLVCGFVIVLAAITFGCVSRLPETHRRDL
ncbi:MFS transporter [Microlunatus soli]|uniref:Putative proline/betaine transporter n=1 Tax=Microlunatus soli TaxID=630515 RepID=A0A1H1NSX7_9ACTN|nr:MFS transporter [Microlunatus soli]SDS02086.1 Major Facilitator Superfamily protein [Microlunatus soli]